MIDADDVTLENYSDNRHGFMRIQVTDKLIIGEYYATNLPHESWTGQAQRIDTFELDYKQHKLNEHKITAVIKVKAPFICISRYY